jgi:hypothetical protein
MHTPQRLKIHHSLDRIRNFVSQFSNKFAAKTSLTIPCNAPRT